jgi:hypothetical protein
MKTRTALKVVTAFMALSFFVAPAAQAGGFKLFGSMIEMAYAPPVQSLDNRFEQFDEDDEFHVLNDAWLGMPVRSQDGKIIGFVEDAFLTEDGDVSELLVGLNDKKFSVYIDGKFAELTDATVNVSLDTTTIAGLEREEQVQLSAR